MIVEFVEDFATRKKGERVEMGEELAMYLINIDKVAKRVEKVIETKPKKEKVVE